MPAERPPISFDLTSQPWLPVQGLNGLEAELSLLEVFEQAEDLRRLIGDVPTQEFALLRLLLAILHDAIDGPADIEEWQELWESGLPINDIADYLSEHRERFDLLHPTTPFFQVAGLRTAAGEAAPLNCIVADVPNGAPFFTMRAQGATHIGFAEAARWVVHAHAFDTSGIKSGAVGDPRVKGGKVYPQGVAWAGNLGGVLAEGENLSKTLLLNLIAADTTNLRFGTDDRPAWRRNPCGPAAARSRELAFRPAGLRELYTWQSRRLRLHYDADGVHGVVLAYGDPLAAHEMLRCEPMTAWRRSTTQEKKLGQTPVYLPLTHDPARAAWRGLAALVAERAQGPGQSNDPAARVRPRILDWVARLTNEDCLPADYLIRARLFGAAYGTQQSVIDEVIDDAVTMAVVLLHERDTRYGQAAVDAVGDANAAVGVLGDLAAELAEAAGSKPAPPRTAAYDLGFATLDASFRGWLQKLGHRDNPIEQRQVWRDEAHRIISRLGNDLLAAAGDAAWEGRIIETRKGTSIWLTASQADLRFRYRLRNALGAPSAQHSAVQIVEAS